MTNSKKYTQRRSKRPFSPSPKEKATFKYSIGFVLLGVAFLALGQYLKARNPEPALDGPIECLLHVELPDETPEQLIDYTGFTVSFNAAHHEPNYCAWELTSEKAHGTLPRKSKFKADPDVYGCPTLDDYKNSGFDRGHMAPAGDMKWNQNAMDDSHYLTNMCPQDRTINGGRWSTLEKKCREWADRDSLLIIISGPILSDVMPRAIGASHISVPERFFKVILSPYTIPPAAIGFIVPNSPTDEGIESMAVSVDQIEEITGFNFFSCLPDDIEEAIEKEVKYKLWNRPKR